MTQKIHVSPFLGCGCDHFCNICIHGAMLQCFINPIIFQVICMPIYLMWERTDICYNKTSRQTIEQCVS